MRVCVGGGGGVSTCWCTDEHVSVGVVESVEGLALDGVEEVDAALGVEPLKARAAQGTDRHWMCVQQVGVRRRQ